MKIAIAVIASTLVALSAAYPFPYPQDADELAAPRSGGGYGKQPDGYFQYVNVPAHKEYEFGWNRGNPHHYISRYEQAKDHRFRTRVRWGDKHGGYGEHYWEYNHAPKDYKHHKEPVYHEPIIHAAPPKYPAAAAA